MKIKKLGAKMFLGFGVVLALVILLIFVAWSVIRSTTGAYDGLLATEIKFASNHVNISFGLSIVMTSCWGCCIPSNALSPFLIKIHDTSIEN